MADTTSEKKTDSASLFPREVRQRMEETAAAMVHLQDRWPRTVKLGIDADLSVYDGYPYLFLNAFPPLDPQPVAQLALAARLFASSLFLADDLMDEPQARGDATLNLLRLQAMQHEGYRALHELFPAGTKFWNRFRDYLAAYTDACMREWLFAAPGASWSELDEETALRIARGKSGLARFVVAGLAELAGDDSLVAPFTEAVNQYYIARQMLDDLCDWKDDLARGFPSLLLVRAAGKRSAGGPRELAGQSEAVGREIYYGGHARATLRIAIAAADAADRHTAAFPDLLWHRVVAKLRHNITGLAADIDCIVANNLQRARTARPVSLDLPPPQGAWQEIGWDALRFVVRQWELGFGEARHMMLFPHGDGFTAVTECQSNDVFQRALIADVLADAQEAVGSLAPLLQAEADLLIERRERSGFGGWRYFPGVPELAPDADDLGQILQVLVRAGRRTDAVEHCEESLEVLLRDNAREDGSFATWIVPAAGRTPEQERQAVFNRTLWPQGPDEEVVANLLYALHLYEPARFADRLAAGAAWLEERQREDGSWKSTWYFGPFYGTYVAVRLLAALRPASPATARAAEYLRAAQNADGGWGLDEESDPLSTALALLGLALIPPAAHSVDDELRAERARLFLAAGQTESGGWPSVRFLSYRPGESYGSRTMSSAYVLKAALAWQRLSADPAAVGAGLVAAPASAPAAMEAR